MRFRTDLAIENRQMYEETHGKSDIEGVTITKRSYGEDILATEITIESEIGARHLEKPAGRYVTIELDRLLEGRNEIKRRASQALASELEKMIPFSYELKVLVAGLGNIQVTPDALGPRTLQKVDITRHLFIAYEAEGDEEMACVSGIAPGVTGTTGLETAEIIKKTAEIAKPDVIVAVDSLAARDIKRVSTTIQINDTVIYPGGGMGNTRTELSRETVGAKVVSIGVPTVIDSKTLILEAMGDEQAEEYFRNRDMDMIVTSTDIDQIIKDFSDIIANGINIALHPGIYSYENILEEKQ